MPFNIALSGLNAATTDLDVTANNIANTATVGFKGSRAEFSELFSAIGQDLDKTQVGSGVTVSNIAQQFNSGDYENTGNGLDFAIHGDGFFVMHDDKGFTYTRAGALEQDDQGFVTNAAGQNLQVFPPSNDGGFDTSTLTDLKVDTATLPAQATTNATFSLNLPSNASAPATAPFDPTDSDTFNESVPFTVHDSLGGTHEAKIFFVKDDAAGANTWTAHLTLDGNPAGAAAGQQVTFNNDGSIDQANSQLDFAGLDAGAGANPLDLTLDLSSVTQTGDSFTPGSVQPNGSAAGDYTGLNIGSDGIISAQYSNGETRDLGQIAVATFANPQGLAQADNTSWTPTLSSGDASLGGAASGQRGSISSGQLESSNTSDLTDQLVNMIRAQRNYQANAKVISTDDQLTKTIINLTS